VFPKPYEQWTKAHRDAIFPLLMLLSFCFSFGMYVAHFQRPCMLLTKIIKNNSLRRYSFIWELMVHPPDAYAKELCFWLFLMNATTSSQDWFKSIYFLIWSSGSAAALVTVPTVTAVFHSDPFMVCLVHFLARGG
jgi:hypothetical protein